MVAMDIRITSVIQTYQRLLNSKSYISSTALGANGAANKLFIAFLFNDPDVGARFLKDVGPIPSSMACCKCGSQMSWCNLKDGYRWRCRSTHRVPLFTPLDIVQTNFC